MSRSQESLLRLTLANHLRLQHQPRQQTQAQQQQQEQDQQQTGSLTGLATRGSARRAPCVAACCQRASSGLGCLRQKR